MTTTTKSRKRSASKPKVDTYQRVTDIIIEQLEAGASANDWSQPWKAISDLPRNVASRKAYRGINTLLLAMEQMANGYASNEWGTYNQWKAKGAQVRRGEKSSVAVLWRPFEKADKADPDKKVKHLLVRIFAVFNADQVDGYTPKVREQPMHTEERCTTVDAIIAETEADIRFGGDRAYYTPAADRIALPKFETFRSANDFYSTAFHELTHWTGPATRCDRTEGMFNRFGSEQYAAEELVAELGSAFAMATVGLEAEPRLDHAQYIDSWLKLLKHDNRAIFTAAAHAQRAVDFIIGVDVPDTDDDDDQDEVEAA